MPAGTGEAMNEHQIRQHLFQILHRIAPEADLDHINPAQNLREALDIDSFDFLNVIIGLNEKLGVNIPESDYRQISTLNEMMRYLAKTISQTSPTG
jgi:acyl carrier protein